ncbi:hypothetical protein FB451DRAFT_1338835 [Mycena latifolia]|nr:hypothetical protein FB451DRAFT_1338835 [Mycena latifolia]
MACLRVADVTTLETANMNIDADGFYGTVSLVPVVDGEFMALAQGKVNGALLSVTNALEGTIFVNQSTSATANATQYALDLYPNFAPAQADRVGALYAGMGTTVPDQRPVWNSLFICPTYYILHAFDGRAFKGEFAVPEALHGRDLPYIFRSLKIDRKWGSGGAEMLFDKTEADVPDVRLVRTSDALLERCAFWNSVSILTAR